MPSACGARCTSRRSNTHSIELREVRYPWPLGADGCRVEQDQRGSLQELPAWMFDTAASQIQIAMRAAVSCEALRDLKALLRGNPAQPGRGGVVENQHQSLQSSGDADGKAETSWVYSTPTIPIQVQVPAVAGPTRPNSQEVTSGEERRLWWGRAEQLLNVATDRALYVLWTSRNLPFSPLLRRVVA